MGGGWPITSGLLRDGSWRHILGGYLEWQGDGGDCTNTPHLQTTVGLDAGTGSTGKSDQGKTSAIPVSIHPYTPLGKGLAGG